MLHKIGQEDLMLKVVCPLITLMEDHAKEAERIGLNGKISLLHQLTTTLKPILGTRVT